MEIIPMPNRLLRAITLRQIAIQVDRRASPRVDRAVASKLFREQMISLLGNGSIGSL
jgi:hypothetical protein